MKRWEQGAMRRGQLLTAALVCLVLGISVVTTGWSVTEALSDRNVATETTRLQLAAQSVATADALATAGVETTPADLVDLAAAVELLNGDHALALSTLQHSERQEAERLMAEIAGCGIMLLSPGEDHAPPHNHEELQSLLSIGSSRALANAAGAERGALWSLLVAAITAAAGGYFLVRSRTSEIQLRHELVQQANTDLLTGLPNRRVLDPELTGARAKMDQTGCTTGLIFLDLDGFKDINDTLGHQTGDELLTLVAQRLVAAQRPDDVLLRLGGDEFAVLLSGLERPADAERAAERYLQVLAAPFPIESRPERLRTSMGVTTTADPAGVASLAAEADIAMYYAKRSGGDRIAVFEPSMQVYSDETGRIARALRSAIHDDEFRIAYQPIVEIEHGSTTGFEALLRWASPAIGEVGPNEFIPVAERSGEICDIGRWVLDNVCRQVDSWNRAGDHLEATVSCNVSPYQLAEPDFVQDVLHSLATWQVAPERIVIEVTESAVLDHRGVAIQRLAELRRAGIRVSIDDFGSGYSNLGQLLHVPFDIIKIDRSLLVTLTEMRQRAGGDSTDPCAIMEAVASIASVFDAPVVCEGVETEQQLRSLRASGITHVQGYLTGRPAPAESHRSPEGSKLLSA